MKFYHILLLSLFLVASFSKRDSDVIELTDENFLSRINEESEALWLIEL